MHILSFNDWLNYSGEYLLEANNFGHSHSTHIDDLPLVAGTKGIAQALAGLLSIKKVFGKTSGTPVTVKVDGSPAVIFGYLNDKFFVASKSIFNKEPKINYSVEDIDKNHPSGPHDALVAAFNYLKPITPKGRVYQGDCLFTSTSKQSINKDGIDYIAFHPNTILYMVEKNSPIGKRVESAKFGIVVHTEYIPDIPPRIKAFGVKENEFKKSDNVFLIDAFHSHVNEIAFNTQEQYEWSTFVTKLKSITIASAKENVIKELMTFVNTYVRSGINNPDGNTTYNDFIDYLNVKKQKDINSKKSDKGKASAATKWDNLINDVVSCKNSIINMIAAKNIITTLKLMLIRKLDTVSTLKTFVKKSNGSLEVTGNEGFVITSTSAKGAKLVDRLEFSKNNFSNEILHGWEH